MAVYRVFFSLGWRFRLKMHAEFFFHSITILFLRCYQIGAGFYKETFMCRNPITMDKRLRQCRFWIQSHCSCGGGLILGSLRTLFFLTAPPIGVPGGLPVPSDRYCSPLGSRLSRELVCGNVAILLGVGIAP